MMIKTLIPMLLVLLMLAIAGCKPAQSTTPAGQPPGQSAPPAQITPAPQNQSDVVAESVEKQALLHEISRAAREGKVPECDFAAKSTTIDAIEKVWGAPPKMEYIAQAKGTYASYPERGVVFGFNKGMQVFEVRSNLSQVQKLSSDEVIAVLGEPVMFRTLGSQQMYGYLAGDYRLEFIFSPPVGLETRLMVDHINVLYPPATVNMMADDPGRQW